MKKFFKILLKVLLSLLGLVIVAAAVVSLYVYTNFVKVDRGDSYRKIPVESLTVNGYTFLDLNRNGKLDVYEDTREDLNVRVNDLYAQMTLQEKLRLLRGAGMKSVYSLDATNEVVQGAAGTTTAIPRLGIPTLFLSDGPAGLRISAERKNDEKKYYATAFPIGTLLASSWDVNLVEEVGKAMGQEAVAYGVDVILGPGVNIHRNPLCGRNFEYYSEDPLLTGEIGAAMVNGIEANGVGASVKHFVANNQETNRNFNNVKVSPRALREIYLKGFEIIVKKARPWTIMSSYNKLNGTYTSESRELLTGILRDEWGFPGLVMTDWFGGKNPPAQIHAGNDLLEPGTRKQYRLLKKAVKTGTLAEEDVETSVKRILRMVLNSRKMVPGRFGNNPDLEAHAVLTRQSAAEGMILLKNEVVLPLADVKNIALYGKFSYDFIPGGTGSGDVNEAYVVSLEEGLVNAGYTVDPEVKRAFDGFRELHAEEFTKPEGFFQAMLHPYNPPEWNPAPEELTRYAENSDVAVITLGRISGEGFDRVEKDDFLLTHKEQELLRNVCEAYHSAGKKVIVVLNVGGVVETVSWKDQVDAILLAWQAGQEGGNSVADVLSGNVNPCGKLPMTFPINLADHPSSANFPMKAGSIDVKSLLFGAKEKPEDQLVANVDYTEYKEGIYVGYRHFDTKSVEVSYPFGFGLSYTHFDYQDMEVEVAEDTLRIKVRVENTGDVAGKEVVEIYVAKPDASVDRPVHELKAFAKTPVLQAGEGADLGFRIPVSDLSYWDEDASNWKLETGTYVIEAAASSRDIRLSKEISVGL